MPLISLTYVSSETHPMTNEELVAILETSHRNNAKVNITGMLLYGGGYFIQALEGEAADVNAIYSKIRLDDRHDNLLVVARDPIEKRAFTDWSMGFKNLHEVDTKIIEGYTDLLDVKKRGTFFTENPTRATKLINLFVAKISAE